MHILVANDDGIHAQGILSLASFLATFATVTVVAPDRPQSASSHAITLHKPLYSDRVDFAPGIAAYQVNGTPADCVKLGVGALCAEAFTEPLDLVVSGINAGANLGHDIVYSGTASAAAEGALLGLPAMALSLTDAPFDYTAGTFIAKLLIYNILKYGLPQGTYLNVNIPPGAYDEFQGIAMTKVGIRKYHNDYTKRIDPLGRHYYWQVGEPIEMENEPDSDVSAISQGMVSVTPIKRDFTNTEVLATLRQWKITL